MCGIFGFAWSKSCKLTTKQREDLVDALSYLNDQRGGDSWGFLCLDDKMQPIRKIGLGHLQNSDSKEISAYPMGFLHSRAATMGSIKIQNCHPFIQGDVIGAHNGVINNTKSLELKYNRKFDVDSQHIFAHLDEGMDLSELEGWGVIEYWDKKNPKKMFISKIGAGELAMFVLGTPSNKEGVIWTSDRTHGLMALKYAQITNAYEVKVKSYKVYSVNFDTRDDFKETRMKLELGASVQLFCSHKNKYARCCDEYDISVCDDCASIMSIDDCDHASK